jgi:hypothetical protein
LFAQQRRHQKQAGSPTEVNASIVYLCDDSNRASFKTAANPPRVWSIPPFCCLPFLLTTSKVRKWCSKEFGSFHPTPYAVEMYHHRLVKTASSMGSIRADGVRIASVVELKTIIVGHETTSCSGKMKTREQSVSRSPFLVKRLLQREQYLQRIIAQGARCFAPTVWSSVRPTDR